MKLERLLILDVETTGLAPVEGQIIEAAGVLFDVAHAEVIEARSLCVHAPTNPAAGVNGLSVPFLRSLPSLPDASPRDREAPALDLLFDMASRADAFVAHRASFDMRWLPLALVRLAPWICSKFSCDWPEGCYGDHLVHLAIAHGVPVVGAHRALGDCMLIVEIMRACHHRWAGVQAAGGRDRRALPEILERGLARGVGDPPRCAHGLEERRQCPNYVRTYRRDAVSPRACPDHGGSVQWLS